MSGSSTPQTQMCTHWQAANKLRHGISFEDAATVFEGPVLARDDPRSYGERRKLSVGRVGEEAIIAVVQTDRLGVTRLISARKAKAGDRET